MIRILLTVLVLALPGSIAEAHEPGDSYLAITEEAPGDFALQWDIALRDLDHAIGLDSDGDGHLTWGEVKARETAISAYAGSRLKLDAEGRACPLGPMKTLIDQHGGRSHAVLRFRSTCASPVEQLGVDYRLMFDLDRQHRGVFSLSAGELAATFVFSPDRTRAAFDIQ